MIHEFLWAGWGSGTEMEMLRETKLYLWLARRNGEIRYLITAISIPCEFTIQNHSQKVSYSMTLLLHRQAHFVSFRSSSAAHRMTWWPKKRDSQSKQQHVAKIYSKNTLPFLTIRWVGAIDLISVNWNELGFEAYIWASLNRRLWWAATWFGVVFKKINCGLFAK